MEVVVVVVVGGGSNGRNGGGGGSSLHGDNRGNPRTSTYKDILKCKPCFFYEN